MQTAKVIVNLGGDKGNQVPKIATAAEIAVLRAIHGDESVQDIEPFEDVQRSNREELDRLRAIYGRATDGENHPHINRLFPGAGARVFQTLDELDLPESFFKPLTRAQARPAPVAEAPAVSKVDPLDHDGDGKKGGSKARKAKAAEPEVVETSVPAEPEVVETSVPADTESDGVAEMADAGKELFA